MKPEIKQRIEQIQNGEIPDGYKKTKTGVIPTSWSYEKLSSFLIQHHEVSSHNNQYPVLTSSRRGIFFQNQYYEKEVASEDNTGYNVVPRGYFTYRHMSDDEIFVFNINTICDKGIVSTLYPVFTVNSGINPIFLQEILNNGSDFKRYARIQKQGGSRTYMYFNKLAKLSIPIPPLAEQERIVNILSTQDKVIECYEKKIEQLKQMKKYYLQNMFPKRGESAPKIRFKGFTDPWKKRKFGEIYKKISEKNDLSYGKDDIISVANMYFKLDSRITDQEYLRTYNVFHLGDIAFEGNKSKNYAHGRFVENTIGNGIVSHVFDVFRPIAEYDLLFWKYAINNECVMGSILIRCTIASTMMTNLVARDFLRESIYIPSIEEQIKIGSFLDELDKNITIHQRKLEEEKKKKKALQQLLLTGIVRVKL